MELGQETDHEVIPISTNIFF